MGGACSTHRNDEKCVLYLESLKREDHSEDLSTDGRINNKMDLKEIVLCGVDLIYLA
jgi:hypothetical protein